MAFEAEVARGIALLDECVPDWRSKIDLDRLDMGVPVCDAESSFCGCILAQVFLDYEEGCAELEFDSGSPYGFDDDELRYTELTGAWRRALTSEAGS